MSEKVFYKGSDILINSEPDIKKGSQIQFCLYSISRKQEVVLENRDYDKPFLEFLLYK